MVNVQGLLPDRGHGGGSIAVQLCISTFVSVKPVDIFEETSDNFHPCYVFLSTTLAICSHNEVLGHLQLCVAIKTVILAKI